MGKSQSKQLAKLLQQAGESKDDWMVRALYLAQALENKGVNTAPILTMGRAKIYPLLGMAILLNPAQLEERADPEINPPKLDHFEEMERLDKMPKGFMLTIINVTPGLYQMGYEYKGFVYRSYSCYGFTEALSRCLNVFEDKHIDYYSGDMTDER